MKYRNVHEVKRYFYSILNPHDGHAGVWTSFADTKCNTNGFLNNFIQGMAIEIYPKKSVLSMADNRGATNLKMFCADNTVLIASNNDKR